MTGKKMTAVNPAVLTWARQTAGRTLDETAARLRVAPSRLAKWESGEDHPVYGHLETLSQFYGRPIALFFFPEPPTEHTPADDFRTLPDEELSDLDADTRSALREAHHRQMTLLEISGGVNPAASPLFKAIEMKKGMSSSRLAAAVRKHLGISVATQKSWGDPDHALKSWRDAVESVGGIYVFKRPFAADGVSGFCLYDATFPIVVLNNSNTFPRQIFTLFHEVAHILHQVSGITFDDDDHLASMTGADRATEIRCNRFAGTFLVPKADFESECADDSDREVARLARTYSVSKHVILRRMRDLDFIDDADYHARVPRFYRRSHTQDGGNYYYTQAAYLGSNFLRLAFRARDSGRYSEEQLSRALGVKATNLGALEELVG